MHVISLYVHCKSISVAKSRKCYVMLRNFRLLAIVALSHSSSMDSPRFFLFKTTLAINLLCIKTLYPGGLKAQLSTDCIYSLWCYAQSEIEMFTRSGVILVGV